MKSFFANENTIMTMIWRLIDDEARFEGIITRHIAIEIFQNARFLIFENNFENNSGRPYFESRYL